MGFWADIQKEASQNSAISSNVVCLRLMFVTQLRFAGNYFDSLVAKHSQLFFVKHRNFIADGELLSVSAWKGTGAIITTARDVK
jgi:hypothetical protein